MNRTFVLLRFPTLPGVILAALLFVSTLQTAPAQQSGLTPRQVFELAQKAEADGDYFKAIGYYQQLVRKYPQDPKLRYRLAQAKMAAREGRPKATMETPLKSVIIPNVSFEDADLETVFTFLRQKTEEISGGRVRVNFIYRGSAEERREGRVSLTLNHVPVTEIIRYVGDLTGTVFKYEPHAVVGTPQRMVVPEGGTTPPPKNDPFA